MSETLIAPPEVEHRSAELVEVSFPKRIIELVVMPYEREAEVAYRGRMITEVCSKGAYDGVEKRTSQIRVNREHERAAVCGKPVALHPTRQEGLVAEVRMSRTELGEESLVLADDGLLGASAGFALMRKGGETGPIVPNAEVWETRSRRRLNHLRLDHIALTAAPAYGGTDPLDVRNAARLAAATPNRDQIELDMWLQRRADMDRRYSVSR
jgi:phage head maturation protease